jgi:hypothetical protein
VKELLILKKLLLNRWGWISWLIANAIVSFPWLIMGAMWIITGEHWFLATATAIWTFQMLPIPLESILVFIITIFFFTVVFKKKIV